MYLLPLSNIFFHGDYNFLAAAAATKLLQLCPTLCDPIDCSPPVSPIPGTLQTRILEWVAISFSNAWKWKVKGKLLSHVRLFATPWTADYQAPPSMGFSRQEYWSGVPFPSPISQSYENIIGTLTFVLVQSTWIMFLYICRKSPLCILHTFNSKTESLIIVELLLIH